MKTILLWVLRHSIGAIALCVIAAGTVIPLVADVPVVGLLGRPVAAAVGFVSGVLAAAATLGFLYLLFDIADNTRETARLLREGSFPAPEARTSRHPSTKRPDRVEPTL